MTTSKKKANSLAIIWDLDGVLANSDHRLHYIVEDRANPDWESYHKHTLDDTPIKTGIILFQALAHMGYHQFICTARPESNRNLTTQWLYNQQIAATSQQLFPYTELRLFPYTELLMRADDDRREGHLVKLDMLRNIWDMGYEVAMAFDDHPEIVNMYRMSGVPCFAADPRHWHEASVQKIAAECKRAG